MAENGNGNGLVTMTQTEMLQIFSQVVQRINWRHGVSFQGHRDLYETLGYQRTLEYKDYYARYKRGGIAKPIINAFPEDTWRKPPIVREADKADELVETPFEEAWEELATRLKLWRVFERVDRQASLGHYAVLVMSLRRQVDWGAPASPVRSADDLIQIQAFSEEHAPILAVVDDDKLPSFGHPRLYNIDFNRRQAEFLLSHQMIRPAIGGLYGQLIPVHASRIIHVAEDGLEDDIIGTPRLQAVWNYLDDLDKMAGGTAEMFWQDAKRRMVMALRDGAVLNDDDTNALDDRIDEFIHGLRNILKVQGMDVTQLAGNAPDASNNIDKSIELIAGTIRMPKRRLLGSERGELASSEDEGNWLVNTIGGRQQKHAEPMILRAFIDWCIQYKVLPTPAKGYEVEWPPLLTETELEKANAAKAWAEAIAKQAGAFRSPSEVMPDSFFRTDIMGWDKGQEEAIQDELGKQEAEQPARMPPQRQVPDPDDDAEAADTEDAA